jgi:hypothetical protein
MRKSCSQQASKRQTSSVNPIHKPKALTSSTLTAHHWMYLSLCTTTKFHPTLECHNIGWLRHWLDERSLSTPSPVGAALRCNCRLVHPTHI